MQVHMEEHGAGDAKWNREAIPQGFHFHMTCQASQHCGGLIVMGTRELGPDPSPEEPGDMEIWYAVRAVWPPLPLIDVPNGVPSHIAEDAATAGACLWMDPDATATRLRRITEALFPSDTRAALSNRIRNSPTENDEKTLAHGLRVLGNEGTHERGLDAHVVIEGAEILSHLLYERFPPATSRPNRLRTAQRWHDSRKAD